jgi:hypothetical protein
MIRHHSPGTSGENELYLQARRLIRVGEVSRWAASGQMAADGKWKPDPMGGRSHEVHSHECRGNDLEFTAACCFSSHILEFMFSDHVEATALFATCQLIAELTRGGLQMSRPSPTAPMAHTRGHESHPRGYTAMISTGDGGPARTRTRNQGIMSTLLPSKSVKKAEER